MKSFVLFLLVIAFAQNIQHAQAEGVLTSEITPIQLLATNAKGADLRPQVNALVALVQAKRFDDADHKAVELCKAFEATFDPKLKQYTFVSREEFLEFSKFTTEKFEWIDWGYHDCRQMQAFIASERKDFAAALSLLVPIESIAPASAGTVTEIGYTYNQLGKSEDALASYRRAYAIAQRYESQRTYRAPALRGAGTALIDLHRLDEAERTFQQSLEIDPGNKVALNELTYIHNLQHK